jgi:hypothetical protein
VRAREAPNYQSTVASGNVPRDGSFVRGARATAARERGCALALLIRTIQPTESPNWVSGIQGENSGRASFEFLIGTAGDDPVEAG